jgi:hypothetical protein
MRRPRTQRDAGRWRRLQVLPRRVWYGVSLQLVYLRDHWSQRVRRNGCVTPDDSYHALAEKWRACLPALDGFLSQTRPDTDPDEITKLGEGALERRFTLLGHAFHVEKSPRSIGDGWRRDPSSGHAWDRDTWYRHVRRGLPEGVDIRLPWELSRCHHFVTLGESYRATGDERYACEFRDQIADWIQSNPARRGPNWASTMEVGIRAANWLVGLLYFAQSSNLDDAFLATLLRSLDEHGGHIRGNLERISVATSNHYIGNLAGLYFIARLAPVLPRSERWGGLAKKELEREIFKQTYEDGWGFEASTAYHRFVSEMFLYSAILGRSTGDSFSADLWQRLTLMLNVMAACGKDAGRLPQVGDNDSGRFLQFPACAAEPDQLRADDLLELEARGSGRRLRPDPTESAVYRDTGRFLFRSPSVYLLIVAGPKGQSGRGGHAHNDILAYELSVRGCDLIVDPGTFVYTGSPTERNRFRSIANHSTLHWPGIEPCSLDRGLFSLQEEGRLEVEDCVLDESCDAFVGVYRYAGHFHRREVRLWKATEKVEVMDRCSTSGAVLTFVCAPGIEPVIDGDSCRIGEATFTFENAGDMVIEPSDYSPAYGRRVSNKVLRVTVQTDWCAHRIEVA